VCTIYISQQRTIVLRRMLTSVVHRQSHARLVLLSTPACIIDMLRPLFGRGLNGCLPDDSARTVDRTTRLRLTGAKLAVVRGAALNLRERLRSLGVPLVLRTDSTAAALAQLVGATGAEAVITEASCEQR
jgi:hypothetical protein